MECFRIENQDFPGNCLIAMKTHEKWKRYGNICGMLPEFFTVWGAKHMSRLGGQPHAEPPSV